MPEFMKRGATLMTISPLKPDNSLTIQEKHSITFDVLSDLENKVAREYGLVYRLDEALQPIYETFGINLAEANGDDSWELPLTPTYVIDTNGVIRYAHLDADYRVRMEPNDILAVLDEL